MNVFRIIFIFREMFGTNYCNRVLRSIRGRVYAHRRFYEITLYRLQMMLQIAIQDIHRTLNNVVPTGGYQ